VKKQKLIQLSCFFSIFYTDNDFSCGDFEAISA